MQNSELLLHLRQDVDQGQERVQVDHHQCGEDRAHQHDGHLLDVSHESMSGLSASRETSRVYDDDDYYTLLPRRNELPCASAILHTKLLQPTSR